MTDEHKTTGEERKSINLFLFNVFNMFIRVVVFCSITNIRIMS